MSMSLKIDYLLFRIRKVLWDKMKQAGIIRKRPIFDAGGVYTKHSMVKKY